MNALTVFAFLTFVELSYLSKCPIPCTKLSSYQVSCGFLDLWKCTYYRAEAHICYKDCVHGGWSNFKKLGECSTTCGEGKRAVVYERICDNPPPANGGNICDGDPHDVRFVSCNTRPCPIQGFWTDFKLESNGSCNEFQQRNITYKRTCINPKPEIKDFECNGSDTKTVQELCPVDGKWTEWTVKDLSECSATCGKGEKDVLYTRTCTNPPPLYGGKDCEGINFNSTVQTCFNGMCPIDGGWTRYVVKVVEVCQATCGKTFQNIIMNRSCTNPIPQYGGKYCEGPTEMKTPRPCLLDPCPGDG